MKGFYEKIKRNKLRSALIGCCAFLFGFISVSIFNNIGNTYAVTTDACYVCSGNAQKGTYVWGGDTYSNSLYCTPASEYKNKAECESQNTAGCYFCSGNTTGKYVWGNYSNNTTYCKPKSYGSQSSCEAKNIVEFSATFDANGGTLAGQTTASCETSTGSSACKVTAPFAIKDGYQLLGWSITKEGCNNGIYTRLTGSNEIYLNNVYQGDLYACWGANPTDPSGYNDVPTSSGNTTEEGNVIAYTREFYKVTYNLNGGNWIDGTTASRVTYIPSDKIIGEFKTNPIKEGKKFKEWQLNETKFNFDQKPTADITLTAVYEDLTEEDKLYYCENESHILDPAAKLCYNVLKPDDTKTHNYSLYEYNSKATFCYAASSTNAGGIHFRADDEYFTMSEHETITGKAADPTSNYSGYSEEEAWVSNDTCRIASKCTETDQSKDILANGCQIKWDAIIYSSSLAKMKEPTFEEDKEPTPTPGGDNGSNDNKEETPEENDGKDEGTGKEEGTTEEPSKPNNDKTDEELKENEKTGDVLIIIAWLVGLSALGYTAYYFIKGNKEY